MSSLISRDAVSSWLKQYGQDVLHGKYKFSLMYIWKNLMSLPSAEPEIIMCKDCIHNGSYDTDCPITWSGKEYCSFAEKRTE